ncbi:MAG: diaminopimelate epimerase [Ignavibacteriales bacterium CG12_big_fil_rev_8_21_14_0_65_30_8]|nr:MAG: diaminopimelate epimerase [Ignavibacteriales bacterium CG12_big_fil_rev_8_21_14_0_65_30_8]
MQKLLFTKMSGAGNDFIFLDERENPGLTISNDLVKKICNRKTGIGADGLICIKDMENFDFEMQYFNSDATTNTLCGNGARCAIKYANDSNRLNSPDVKFLSNNITYSGKVLGEDLIRFDFLPPQKIKLNFKVKAANQLITANYADTGSPHIVIKIEDVLRDSKKLYSNYAKLSEFPVYKIGKEIRNLPEFSPGGTNVNFIKIIDDVVHIRTYERGVENETLACGTGSVASALIVNLLDILKPPITLITKNEDKLIVDFKKDNDIFKNISLTGPAKTMFIGEYFLNL